MTILATVKRNGANTKLEIANEFIAQSGLFDNITLGNCLETLRSYERSGLLAITDHFITLYHDC